MAQDKERPASAIAVPIAKQVERMKPRRLLGFTLYCVWVVMMFYSISLYVATSDYRDVLYLNLFISLCVLMVTLFIIGNYFKRADKWVLSKRVIYPCSAALAFGTSVVCLGGGVSAFGIALVSISAIVTGVASAFLFLGWFRLYSDAGSRITGIEASAGWLLSCLATIVLYYLPQPASAAAVIAAPIASGVLLRANAMERPARPVPRREHTLQKRTRRMFIRGSVAALGFGLVDGFSDVISGYRYISIPGSYDVLLMLGGAIVTTVALTIAVMVKKNMVTYLYRLVFLSMAIGCLGTPFLEQTYSIPSTMIFGGYLCFLIVLMVICSDVSNYFDLPATKVIGCALAAQYLGELIGSGTAHAMTITGPVADPAIFEQMSFLLTGILILLNLFLFTEKDLTETSIGEMIDSEEDEAGREILTSEQELEHTVDVLRSRYGLSAREGEVLPLLIKGRTIARIQEELFISQGTVSTHIRHIYQKLGVHNRQSLLDLIDQFDEDHQDKQNAPGHSSNQTE